MQELCKVAVEMLRLGILSIGNFKLSSGQYSPIYVDLRRSLSYPHIYLKLASKLVALASNIIDDVEAVAGLATAGIPWATIIALWFSKPLSYVRLERKGHGRDLVVEGDVAHKRILLVDDVATTGSTLAKAAELLKNVGAEPRHAVVVVDRCQGAFETLKSMGIAFYSVVTLPDILGCLYRRGFIDRKLLDSIEFKECAPSLASFKTS